MSITQQIITIAMVILGTMITRFLPFIAFPAGKETPKYVKYLGLALPGAIFGMLVVYSLKFIDLTTAPYGAAEFLGVLAVVVLHLWKRQMLISIAGGTIVYMILVQMVF